LDRPSNCCRLWRRSDHHGSGYDELKEMSYILEAFSATTIFALCAAGCWVRLIISEVAMAMLGSAEHVESGDADLNS
jgi:hypothetical protein